MKRFVVEVLPPGATEWQRDAVYEGPGAEVALAARLTAPASAGASVRARVDDSAERMGPTVTATVAGALARLTDAGAALDRARALDVRLDAEGRYEWEVWLALRGEVARANHALDYFEALAPKSGVLPADAYERLGARARPRLSAAGASYGADAEAGALARGGARSYRAVAVRFECGATESHDAARARYEAALAAAGWGHAESELSEARLDALAAAGGDAAKLVKNYRTGVITGGELDMKLAQLDGQVA